MKRLYILLLLLNLTICCLAQTVVFKGQVLCDRVPVKNYTLLVSGHTVTTDFEGIFRTPVYSNKTDVDLQESGRQYTIVYPLYKRAPLPKDTNFITLIIVESSSKLINTYTTGYEALKDSAGKSHSQLIALQQQLDSLEKQLKLNYTSQELADARERQDERDRFYPEIYDALHSYIGKAHNLSAAFQYTSSFAFENPKALDDLAQAVESYNPAFDKLGEKNVIYAQNIQEYWQRDTLTAQYKQLAVSLQKVSETIFALNGLKTDINSYFLGQVPNNEKEATKTNIKSRIATIVPALNLQLDSAEKRTDDFLTQLKKNKP